MEAFKCDKYSSLSQQRIEYGCKRFYNTGPSLLDPTLRVGFFHASSENIIPRVEDSESDKHSSLLKYGIDKGFYNTAPL